MAVFDELVGILLGDLYAAFPERIHFTPRQVAERLSVPLKIHEAFSDVKSRKKASIEIEGLCKDFGSYLDDTLVYLTRDGFITREQRSTQMFQRGSVYRSPDRIQLTSLGHKVLRTIPKILKQATR